VQPKNGHRNKLSHVPGSRLLKAGSVCLLAVHAALRQGPAAPGCATTFTETVGCATIGTGNRHDANGVWTVGVGAEFLFLANEWCCGIYDSRGFGNNQGQPAPPWPGAGIPINLSQCPDDLVGLN